MMTAGVGFLSPFWLFILMGANISNKLKIVKNKERNNKSKNISNICHR